MRQSFRQLALIGLLAVYVFAQTPTQINPWQVNFVARFSSPPVAPYSNTPYLFADAITSGVCSGGGTAYSWCIWNGSAFVAAQGTSVGLGDPGSNSIPYRNAPGTTIPAVAANFPTLNQNTTGNAATATAAQTTPTLCSSGSAPTGITGTFNATGCTAFQPAFGSQTANYFYAAPNGAGGTPGFRAIVSADVPTLNQNTTGTAANVTGVVARANGGLNSNSAGTGFLRDGTTPTAGELSGDCATSAGFSLTCTNIGNISAGTLGISYGGTGAGLSAGFPSPHQVFIGPVSGGGPPSFRGLVSSDIPSLSSYVQLGGDLGNSTTTPWVTSTHLSGPLPRSQGGLNTSSPGTGFIRDASTPTQAELSGDITTSGSYATALATVNSGPGTCGDSTHVCQVVTNGKGLTTAQSAVAIASSGTINSAAQYDVTYYSASGANNVISGAAVTGLITGSASGAPTTATAHNISNPLACFDTSGSGTVLVCNTTPTFTPQSGDTIIYRTTTTCGNSPTLAVNGGAATSILKFGGVSSLYPADILANIPALLTFDGTYWQLESMQNNVLVKSAAGSLPFGGGSQILSAVPLDISWMPPGFASTFTSGPVVEPYYIFKGFLINSASGALTFDLPATNTSFAGLERCYRQDTGKTGVITVAVHSSDTIDLNGVAGTTSTGTITSGGALGDQICLISNAAHYWYVTSTHGTWTNH